MESKIKYISPSIELSMLDNEISLALESTPPIGPDEELFSSNQNTDTTINSYLRV